MSRADKLTLRQKKRVVYTDFKTDFSRDEFSYRLNKVENEESVKQAFKNYILTNHGECFFDAEKGGNITSYLFENVTPDMAEGIKLDIQEGIRRYDPRIEIVDIKLPSVDASKNFDLKLFNEEVDENTLSIRIVFRVVNIPDILSVDIDVKRIR